ncbi:hypothetical protein M3Y97_01149100 [Aphelenchoides bicaudatus]|nr:hypothetical protein M3Y97_01149100 [Aphelenchoides bicaudatus]
MSQRPGIDSATFQDDAQRIDGAPVETPQCDDEGIAEIDAIFYKTQQLIGLFIALGAFSLSFENLIYAKIVNTCTETDLTWLYVSIVIVGAALSFLTMVGSVLAFGLSLIYFCHSLSTSIELYKKYHPKRKNSSKEAGKNFHEQFFKHVVIEVISLSIANSILTFLGRNPEEYKKVHTLCHGNFVEDVAISIQLLNDWYGYGAAYFSCIVLIAGLQNWVRWLCRERYYHDSPWKFFVGIINPTKEVVVAIKKNLPEKN